VSAKNRLADFDAVARSYGYKGWADYVAQMNAGIAPIVEPTVLAEKVNPMMSGRYFRDRTPAPDPRQDMRALEARLRELEADRAR
jgi:hypothetical protein